jgi:glycosyltransferase involved in cell wall biosynthesis
MKILHLATSASGGAGIAATRLHEAMLIYGLDSTLTTLSEKQKGHLLENPKNILTRKIFTLVNQLNTRQAFISTSAFSQNSISLKEIRKYSADVIHIHNWYNFLSIDSIIQIARNFPTVITMHDERFFTGACHYSLSCNGFQSSCSNCPAVYLFKKQVSQSKIRLEKALNGEESLGIIAPSNWILHRFHETQLRNKLTCTTKIPNIIPFSIEDGDIEQRQRLSTDWNFLFAAVNPDAPTKGFDLLRDALSELARDNPHQKFTLHVAGKRIKTGDILGNLEVISHGYLSQSSLSLLFEKVDIVIVPSRIDNLPSIISEAQLNGVLVVATNVGGIPELVENEITGLLSEPNILSLRNTLVNAIGLTNESEIISAARSAAQQRHASKKIVRDHLNFYNKVIDLKN